MNDSHTQIRTEIEGVEMELMKLKEKRAELRRQLPREEVKPYTFKDLAGEVALSDLFGESQDLILVHNMGKSCPYCTLWADGLSGVLQHLEDRAAFVVVSPDDPQTQKEFAEGRGWNFRMLSGQGSSFTKDMGYENEEGHVMPGMSTFHKDENGKIERVDTSFFGPGDDFCAVFHMFDMLADGQDGWVAKFSY